jgi:hypothetical protein
MRKTIILLCTSLLGVIVASSFVVVYSSGVSGYSGSPKDGGRTCASCHSGGSATPVASITASPAFGGTGNNLSYVPGTTYTISVTQTSSGYPDFGFDLEILNSNTTSGTDAGSFHALTNCTVNSTGPTNITHTGRIPTNTHATFTWIAPPGGTAYLYATVNGVNGDGGTGGDRVVTSAFVLSSGSPPVCNHYYAPLPYSTSFENTWLMDSCDFGVQRTQDKYWKSSIGGTTPTGNDYWHRNDYTGTDWTSSTSGAFTPAASAGSYSARFHNAPASAASTGLLDLYINLSSAGTKTISFDYIHNEASPSPFSFDVKLSTDGGITFPTTLLTITTALAASWTTQTVTTSVTSATSVIRFSVADKGSADVGIDKLSVLASPTGITDLADGSEFKIYPNPNNGTFTLAVSAQLNEKTLLVIVDGLGRQIHRSLNNPGNTQVDLETSPNGIYFYRVMNEAGDKLLAQGKLVVKH